MGVIKRIDNLAEFQKNMTAAEIAKLSVLDKELSPSREIVKLGDD